MASSLPVTPSAMGNEGTPQLRTPGDHGRSLWHGASLFNGQPGVARLTTSGVSIQRTDPFPAVGGPLGGPQVDTANTTLSQYG